MLGSCRGLICKSLFEKLFFFCKCFFKLIVLIYLIQVYRLVNEDFKVNWVGLTNDHLKHKEKEFRTENPNLIYEPKIESSFMNSLVVKK